MQKILFNNHCETRPYRVNIPYSVERNSSLTFCPQNVTKF
jgi:hypothetical protein